MVRGFPHESLASVVPSVTSIVAVTVHFFISLLFPVKHSYLNLCSLPFMPPILISIASKGRRMG